MSRARLRALSETQVRRVLAAGGMLVESGGQWRAYRCQDARMSAAGCISPLIAGRLKAEGAVHADPQKPRRWLAIQPLAPSGAAIPPPVRLLEGRRGQKPVSLFDTITADLISKPGELARLRAASQRFLVDMHQASTRPSKLGERRPPSMGPEAALSRLAALEAVIGLDRFRQLESLLVRSDTAKAFAREAGLEEPGAYKAALAALMALIEAYDLAIKAPR
ncbi:MAG: hypothetical protein C0456_09030 [Hyphomonas sp.]|uniref:hypothetical protein n=1 Tax=Hyphomonas sp. TaxID=87 RepID=UPI001D2F742A|nr:hypothetical protein [Hyphomonas sp.]MBA4226763.1 hypothetical protein [Hyphomonas sp.]